MAPRILTLEGGEWSASYPNRFTPKETAPGTHCRSKCPPPRGLKKCVTPTGVQPLSQSLYWLHCAYPYLQGHVIISHYQRWIHTTDDIFSLQFRATAVVLGPTSPRPLREIYNVLLPILAAFCSSSPSLYKISKWFISNINYHKLAYICHFQNKIPWLKRFYSIFAPKKKALLVYNSAKIQNY